MYIVRGKTRLNSQARDEPNYALPSWIKERTRDYFVKESRYLASSCNLRLYIGIFLQKQENQP